ncbi:MAG: IPT/TIG domain-containing protein [bacterium]|nr:IPT/TIG domain-containing protein [bacterium]
MVKKIPFLAILLFLPFIANAQAAPTITSISPSSISAGSSATVITVTGTNFESDSTVRIGTVGLTTTFVSSTQLTASIPATQLQTAGTRSITVSNDGTVSNAVSLTVATLPDTGLAPEENQLTAPSTALIGAGLIAIIALLLFASIKLRWVR